MTLWCLFTCVLSVSLQECKFRDSGYEAHHDSKALSSVLFAGTMATVEETDHCQPRIKRLMPQFWMSTAHSSGDVQ